MAPGSHRAGSPLSLGRHLRMDREGPRSAGHASSTRYVVLTIRTDVREPEYVLLLSWPPLQGRQSVLAPFRSSQGRGRGR